MLSSSNIDRFRKSVMKARYPMHVKYFAITLFTAPRQNLMNLSFPTFSPIFTFSAVSAQFGLIFGKLTWFGGFFRKVDPFVESTAFGKSTTLHRLEQITRNYLSLQTVLYLTKPRNKNTITNITNEIITKRKETKSLRNKKKLRTSFTWSQISQVN